MFREFWYAKLSSIENWERNSRNWLLLSILSETQMYKWIYSEKLRRRLESAWYFDWWCYLYLNIKSNKNQLNDITIAFIHTMYMYMLTLDRINLHTDEKWLQNIVINFWIQKKLLIFCYSFQELIGRFCRWNWNWYPIYKGIDSIFFTKLCLI